MRRKKNVNEILEIPKEVYSNIPNIIITGFQEMLVENSKGILEYDDYYIRANTVLGIINIHGTNLRVEKITEDNLKIIGKIESVELEKTVDE